MLPYTMATNPYYFPVVITLVLVLCLRLSTEVSKSMLPVIIQQLTLVVLKSRWHTIFQDRKCIQHAITVFGHSSFGWHFCWSGWSGSSGSPAFTHALIHTNFTSHTTTSPFPSPPTHNSPSLLHLYIQGGHLHSIFQLSHLFLMKSSSF